MRRPEAFSPVRCLPAAAALAVLVLAVTPATAGPAEGRQTAEFWCSNCHRVTPEQATVLRAGAPGFVDIAQRWTATGLKEHFGKLHPITTTYPMPTVALTDREADDVIAYIMTLRRGR